MSDLLRSYAAQGPGHDEMLQASGGTAAAWEQVTERAGLHTSSQVLDYTRRVTAELRTRGLVGLDAPPWPLDPLPLVIGEDEWDPLSGAVAQRLRLLDALLADLYGPRRLLGAGGLPPEIVIGSPGFIREADGIMLPGPRQLTVAGIDVARNADGSWVALTDRTDAVGGLGHAMENRRILAEVLAPSYRSVRVRRLGPFFRELRSQLQTLGERVVVMSAGPSGRGAFDDAALAELLGLPMVEAEDLVVGGSRLWLRTLRAREAVDVVLRAVRGVRCDPLELHAGDGVPGLVHAARQGGVRVANPLGSGVLENPALLTYLPRLCRAVLGEELLLSSAATYWCGDRAMGSHVIANLGRLVIKSAGPKQRAVRGWELSIDERAELSARIAARPWAWVGQEPVRASTSPTVDGGGLTAAPTVLRIFGVAGSEGYHVMPGGLGRVLPAEDGTATALPTRGTAKDVWVVSAGDDAADAGTVTVRGGELLGSRAAADLVRLGWHAEHALGLLHLRELAGAAPSEAGAVARRLVQAAEPLADDVAHLLSSARQVRQELPAGIWEPLARLERALASPADGGSGVTGHSAVDAGDDTDTAAAVTALRQVRAALEEVPEISRSLVAAGRHLAGAEYAAALVAAGVGPTGLAALLGPGPSGAPGPTEAPVPTDTAGDVDIPAHLLWEEPGGASVRHHLDALREAVADLPTLTGDRGHALLGDVEDLLDELAGRPGAADLTDEISGIRWRLGQIRRAVVVPASLRAADLPEERWAT